MWALSDFTEENGATIVVPHSNGWDHDPVMGESYEALPVIMPAGSIAFVVGTCYHGAGENRTAEDRVARIQKIPILPDAAACTARDWNLSKVASAESPWWLDSDQLQLGSGLFVLPVGQQMQEVFQGFGF